jgi:hypothetical protein
MTTTNARIVTMTAVTVAALAWALSGCGSGSPQPSTGQAPAGAVTRTVDPAQRQAINDCLQAAGLPTPTPVRRTAEPGSDAKPEPGSQFSPEARAALEACGIEPPTPAPGTEPTDTAG